MSPRGGQSRCRTSARLQNTTADAMIPLAGATEQSELRVTSEVVARSLTRYGMRIVADETFPAGGESRRTSQRK
jgi:hypothetical protein